MKKKNFFRKLLVAVVCCALLLQISSCGYLLYPERRGQTGERIDVGVAVLDAIGLLFFIIPGLIAFAVDFTNGTIYLPPERRSNLEDSSTRWLALSIPEDKLDKEGIESFVSDYLGRPVSLDSPGVRVLQLNSAEQLLQDALGKRGISLQSWRLKRVG